MLPCDEALVPRRTDKELALDAVDVRIAYILVHADGCASVRDIARATTLDVEEVALAFSLLNELGAVDLVRVGGSGVVGPPDEEPSSATSWPFAERSRRA